MQFSLIICCDLSIFDLHPLFAIKHSYSQALIELTSVTCDLVFWLSFWPYVLNPQLYSSPIHIGKFLWLQEPMKLNTRNLCSSLVLQLHPIVLQYIIFCLSALHHLDSCRLHQHNVVEVGKSEQEEEVEEEEGEEKKTSPITKVLFQLALPLKIIGKCKTMQLSPQSVKDREAESSQRTHGHQPSPVPFSEVPLPFHHPSQQTSPFYSISMPPPSSSFSSSLDQSQDPLYVQHLKNKLCESQEDIARFASNCMNHRRTSMLWYVVSSWRRVCWWRK